jgi:formylglycine-generating enzyme required for sulfatase activity
MITRCWTRFSRFACFLTIALVLGPVAAPAADQQRLALVVGNADYPDASSPVVVALKNARAVAEQLRKAGFEVDLVENLNKDPLQRAVQGFYDKIRPGAAVVFFFSGYGIQATRQNFVIPLNALIWTELDVRRDGLSVEGMLTALGERGATTRIVMLDASRRNPFERRFRSYSAGLGTIETPPNSIIISAASPGKVISDADADSSVFVGELLKELSAPGVPVNEVFNHTREGVSRATNGDQVPWVSSSLGEKFYFGKSVAPQAQSAPPPPPQPPRQTAQQVVPRESPPPLSRPQTPEPQKPAEAAEKPKLPDRKVGEKFQDCPACPELVVVPAGEFEMGSNDLEPEKPIHHVSISRPFAIGRREVTFAEWDQCVTAGACKVKPDDGGRGRNDLPLGGVSWNDSKDYLAWISGKTGAKYRLPTEAEWEFVARGGTASAYWWGAANKPGQANCRDCGGQANGQSSTRVGTYAPNPYGVYDTAGNVAEWVEDCWNPNYKTASSDGSAVTTGQCRLRVLRGGSYENMSKYIRSASRFLYDANVRYAANGFRVLRELP